MFTVIDNLINPDLLKVVRDSALASGFGTWAPGEGDLGRSKYAGINYNGKHGILMEAVSNVMGGTPIFPNQMFFRITRPNECDHGFIHSDRMYGMKTAIIYLTESPKDQPVSGTSFFRHIPTGDLAMPDPVRLTTKEVAQLKKDALEGGDKTWQQTDFVAGVFNRLLVFDAPLYHSRWPKQGYGETNEDGRMVWVTHFDHH